MQEKTALEESAREIEIAKAEEKLLKDEKSKQKKLAAVAKFLNFLKTEIHQF